jgi:2-polyprenyl-3-methyl-5-hydroxy-6-metoxy-1,4-benzoquinol methylase
MKVWTREETLALPLGADTEEIWRLRDGDQLLAEYPVEVKLGKPLDVVGLRGSRPKEFRDQARSYRTPTEQLYGPDRTLVTLKHCPCCAYSVNDAVAVVTVYNGQYRRCMQCGHVFVALQPQPEALLETFSEDEGVADFYVDLAGLEIRMREIIQPKLDWLLEIWSRHRSRAARSVLDVGAGGGQFVAGCQRGELLAEGYELSHAAVRFAKEALGVELRQGDYLEVARGDENFDIVTFWGLLEYASEPAHFIKKARQQLPNDGMLVIEVPRSDAISLAIEQIFPETVWRHALPNSHMNLYSDASLATLLHENGFRIVAAWYFGMDIYELLLQLAISGRNDDDISGWEEVIPKLQAFIDTARLGDDLVIAALPVS